MKTVLIPTDFSKFSRDAFRLSLPLLGNKGEELRVLLLNTFQIPYANPNEMVASHDRFKKNSQDLLRGEIETLKKELDPNWKVSFESLSFLGSLENVIGHVAREEKADLVVLWSNKSSPKEEFLPRLLHRLDRPVLFFPLPVENI